MKSAITAFKDFFNAIPLIGKLKLWPYMLIPGIISSILGLLIFYIGYHFSDDIGAMLLDLLPDSWTDLGFVKKIVNILSGVSIIILGLLIFKYIVIICTGPFMSPLSEKVDAYITSKEVGVSPWNIGYNLKLMVRGLLLALRNIIRELFFVLLLLVISLIPGIGWVISLAIFLVQAYYAGFGNLDFAMERYFSVKESIQFAKSNKGMCLGNGTGFLLLLMIPVLGFFFAPPLATIAGTISLLRKSHPTQTLQRVGR